LRLDWTRVSACCVVIATGWALSAPSPAQARWPFESYSRPWPDARGVPVREREPSRTTRRKTPFVKATKTKEEKLPAGPLHIVISIKQQRLTVYANGQPVAHSPVSTGVPGHPTPQGVFSVIQKNLYHRSNIYSDAPMPFMQRITWSGVAMHEGKLPGYPASHGCIRLPREFAQRLWGITKVGARVVIAQDDVKPMEIAHARLFTAQSALSEDESQQARVKLATAGLVIDAPLKGTIDANAGARVEKLIDEAEAFATGEPGLRETDKGALLASDKDPVLRPGPISVYISRKTGKLQVRKGFEDVLEAPVTIAHPEQPLGTHLFNALRAEDGSVRWNVVSLPVDRTVKKGQYVKTYTRRGELLKKEVAAPVYEHVPPGDPAAALDRITIPEETLARINALMTPGASLMISDLGLSHETGRGTDFIVLTR
jgi:lipoprotein-anchoring transpeptidase ErfK/SrfK